MAIKPTLTASDVMDVLKISRKTLERWEKHQLLIPVRIGGTIRYREADVEALIEQRSA